MFFTKKNEIHILNLQDENFFISFNFWFGLWIHVHSAQVSGVRKLAGERLKKIELKIDFFY